ncbi:LysR family transcriptional regulator [Acetobacterium sp.]|uniref:LysR family transcriptional regulator n=1 Tax=Acetobacterium sp. TaxID=1872094 RepID=UPI002718C2BD|nr:LysR family transcriptional regulator [Acetobacterium sp.]MDO9490928.1 LysR family transcriptional regulator [Acetobacterium sp.]
MDLKQLKTFVVLSKNKNYTRTADALGYAQSSISAQIQQLEQELNTKLLDRIGKKVFLTESGEMFLPYAVEMLTLASTIKDRIDNSLSSHGQIIIGASESLCIFKLPAIVKSFKKTHPNIELHLKLIENDQVVQQLTDNTIDIALTIGNPIKHPSITSLLKKREEILVLSAPTHPLASKNVFAIKDFANQSLVLTSFSCNYRAAFEYDLKAHGIPYQIALESGSVQAIKEMAASGLGLCVLPNLAVQKELTANLLNALPYKNNYNIYTQLVCHDSKWISPNLADFIDLVKELI